MKNLLITITPLILLVLIACGSSQEKKTDVSESATGASIDWVRFDEGLETAAGNGKHVIAYFWRDG